MRWLEGCEYRIKGRRSHWICYGNQFQWSGEQLGDSITSNSAPEILPLLWDMAPFIFCGANSLNVGSSCLEDRWIIQISLYILEPWDLVKPGRLNTGKANVADALELLVWFASFSRKSQQHRKIVIFFPHQCFQSVFRNGFNRICNHS